MTNKGMTAKITEKKILAHLGRRSRTAAEILEGLGLSKPGADDWANWLRLLLNILAQLVNSGILTSIPRRNTGRAGRPPLEFSKAK
jgi:hypothetical protein